MIKDIVFQRNFFRVVYRALRWHLRYAVGRNVSPLACGCYITTRCNFKCEFCNIWRIKPGLQIPADTARRLINQLGKIGVIYFSFSGGEPLLVPYVFDLLAHAKESKILYTHIVSNGYLMDKDNAKELRNARVSEVSLSIDGDEDVHDRNRGMKGAFKKVIEAVDHVKTHAPKTRIVLNTILNPLCIENAIFAVRTAEKLKLKIKVQPINEHPSFGMEKSAVRSRPSLNKHEREKLFDAIDAMQRSSNVVNSGPFLENYKSYMFSPEKLIFAKDNCIFGYHHVEIFQDQIFPCLEGLEWKDGFGISDGSIRKILASGLYHKKLQQLRKCSSCRKNYYVCYYEPRLNFPVWNFVKSRLNIRINTNKC